jgi:hypothetical protein
VGPWGEEKTTKFVNGIVAQQPVLGRLSELYNRLLLGEISIAVTLTDSNINDAKKSNAPVVFAEGIQPIVSPAYHAGVLKGAPHPNTAHLFAMFLPQMRHRTFGRNITVRPRLLSKGPRRTSTSRESKWCSWTRSKQRQWIS